MRTGKWLVTSLMVAFFNLLGTGRFYPVAEKLYLQLLQKNTQVNMCQVTVGCKDPVTVGCKDPVTVGRKDPR